MKRAVRAAEAAQLRAEGLNGLQIAKALGVSRSYAYALLNDPDGSGDKVRKRRYDLSCVDCGGRVDGTTPGRITEPVCRACSNTHYATWTTQAIVLCIQEWAEDHGGIPPSAREWNTARAKAAPVPSVNHVIDRFGTWNAAITAAGFEPHRCGPVGGFKFLTPHERAECARRYAAGESTVRIAADLECSPLSVAKWVRDAGLEMRPAFGRQAA